MIVWWLGGFLTGVLAASTWWVPQLRYAEEQWGAWNEAATDLYREAAAKT